MTIASRSRKHRVYLDQNIIRIVVLVMLTLLNVQEIIEEDFRVSFERADRTFVFKGAKRAECCRMGALEAV